MKKTKIDHYTDKEALEFHNSDKSGKIEIVSSKPMTTKRDLALAYSPGVAAPVKEIAKNPEAAYDYTTKGNLVAVISNGSAILGMGNLGALASKPVMEGKAVLFKRFADINAIDLEIENSNSEEIINSIVNFSKSFGGINLEDIAAPDCFIIEKKLKEKLDIPVFHDDQHGTAIITTAALINALDICKKSIKKIKIVINGAGASAIACSDLFMSTGVPKENITMVDRKGVIYKGRDNLNHWKSSHAINTKNRTLDQAIKGVDVFLGLSAKGILTKKMVKSMGKNPIIFACANPDPEITPEEVNDVRQDAIVATGRSDYPNQVNNLLGFPYIFRGALDVRAKTINEEMKIAAANAIAALARENVPDEVAAAMGGGERPKYGREYIIPSTFDPRLISVIPVAVAKAAIKSGVARKKIDNFEIYKEKLKQRLDPSVTILQGINNQIKKTQKKVVFADGEDENTLKAAIAFKNGGLGIPILVGKKEKIKERLKENNRIKLDRKRLFSILNKNNNSRKEKKWLNNKFKQYGVVNKDLTTLKIRMDIVPVSLAIAQAAKETGWGTSRFALEGNALFGQWTWSKDGMKPSSADIDTNHKVMKFSILQASVRAYQRNLNTHSGYKIFREARAIQRDNYGKLNSLELVDYLDKYAETGIQYTIILKKIIEQNVLTDFDDAELLPTSEKLKKII